MTNNMSKQEAVQYVDIYWIKTFGLNRLNILEYFYTSPFFDQTSCNQALRIQGLPALEKELSGMRGWQFVLDEQFTFEPSLFVIKKFFRTDSRTTSLSDVFYCLDGVFFQCPETLELLRARTSKASLHLSKAFDFIRELYRSEMSVACEDAFEFSPKTDDDSSSSISQHIAGGKRKRISERPLPSFDSTLRDLTNF